MDEFGWEGEDCIPLDTSAEMATFSPQSQGSGQANEAPVFENDNLVDRLKKEEDISGTTQNPAKYTEDYIDSIMNNKEDLKSELEEEGEDW